jgi:raw score 3.57
MPFLRKQFAFWRIFLYFLAFTTLYARLVSQFLFSNLALPTGVGVLSNAVLFGYAAFFSGGMFFLIYFMLIWGISTGFILGLCQFRRSVKGILSATIIGTLTAGISFYITTNDINLYLCLFHGALAAIFGLIAFPNKAGILLESQIMHKILPKAVSTGVNLTNQVIEKKGFASYRWLIPLVFTLLGTIIFGITSILLKQVTDLDSIVALMLFMMVIAVLPMLFTGLTVMFARFHKNFRHLAFSVLIGVLYYSLVAYLFNDSNIEDFRLFAIQNYIALIIAIVLSALISFKKIVPINKIQ